MDTTQILQIATALVGALAAWIMRGMSTKLDKLMEDNTNHRVASAELRAAVAAMDARIARLEERENRDERN